MSHWPIAPILIPLATALIAMLPLGLRAQRAISLGSALLLLAVAAVLVARSDGGAEVYALGNWPAPFGIQLVADRLAALMLSVTALCALACLWHVARGWDEQGTDFHALFHFQITGINGAFLTGDLFNLFVFFELLLIASYGLLQHGGGGARRIAGVHYVVLNLVGSVMFLVAVALIYASLGTLNLADIAQRVLVANDTQMAAVRAGALLLLVVFALKAAVLPLFFWLPATYGSAAAPVAALFVVLSKVGIYAILRVHAGTLAAHAELWQAMHFWLLPAALATIAAGALGALVAATLRELAGYLAVGSSGVVLTAIAVGGVGGLQAAQFYLLGSVLSIAALFLLADSIAASRGKVQDRIVRAAAMQSHAILGALYFVIGTVAAGLPPLSGFIGKALLLRAAVGVPGASWIFAVVLIGSLLSIVALVRAGIQVFWHISDETAARPAQPWRVARRPALLLASVSLLLAVLAGPVTDYAARSAAALAGGATGTGAVLAIATGTIGQ